MSGDLIAAWDARVARLLAYLPVPVQRSVAWLRQPARRWTRVAASFGFILGGFLAVLPVFGLWMLPLGLALLADDIPWMKHPLERAARWLERQWRRLRRR